MDRTKIIIQSLLRSIGPNYSSAHLAQEFSMACALLFGRNKVGQYLILEEVLEYGNHIFDFICSYKALRPGSSKDGKTIFFPSNLIEITLASKSG